MSTIDPKDAEFLKNIIEEALNPGKPQQKAAPENSYFDAFRDGEKKMRSVFEWLETLPQYASLPKESVAYISVGGADGSELAAAFSREEVRHGILMEFDKNILREFPQSLRLLATLEDKISTSMQLKKLEIFTGDAWANRYEVNHLLKRWFDSSQISLAIFSIQSVLHELPTRATSQSYSHLQFLSTLFTGLPSIALVCKEPSHDPTWTGLTDLDTTDADLANQVSRLAEHVANKYPGLFGEWNGRTIDQQASHLTIDGNLALEVAKKLVYRLGEDPQAAAEKLIYEIGENHAQLNRDRFFNECRALFPLRDGVLVRGDGRSKNFDKLWLRSNFSGARVADGQTLPIPAPFLEIVGIRSSQPKSQPESSSNAVPSNSGKDSSVAGTTQPAPDPQSQQDTWSDYVEKMILEGTFIRQDSWTEGPSDEVAFKKKLKKADADSANLIVENRWQDILALWAPCVDNPFFDTTHPAWDERPFFIRKIHEGIGALFFAHVQLVLSDPEHPSLALKFLDAYLNGNPYSMRGGDSTHLEIDDARSANETYLAVLKQAKSWLNQAGNYPFLNRIPKELPVAEHWTFLNDQKDRFETRVRNRIKDVEFILGRHTRK